MRDGHFLARRILELDLSLLALNSDRSGDAQLGRVVQQPTSAGANREHPAGEARGDVRSARGGSGRGGRTQAIHPPEIPGRFKQRGG